MSRAAQSLTLESIEERERTQRIRLALFFIVLLGGFVVFAVVVAGQNLWQQYDTYFIRYTDQSVAGIQVGGTVVYQGIAIGTIESIQIDPQDVESIVVEIRIQEGTPIKTDVTAQIVPVGITGISQIEISGGTREAPRLEPGSFIAPAESTVTQVTESVESILQGIEGLLADLTGVLSQVDQQSIGNILSRLDAMMEENQETVRGLFTELDRAAAGLADVTHEIERVAISAGEVSSSVEQLVRENAPRIEEAVTLLNGALRSANDLVTSDEAQGLVTSAGELTDEFDLLVRRNASDIEEAIETANDTLRLLNNFAFQINADPSLLVVPEERQ